jgi:hypothetical protein
VTTRCDCGTPKKLLAVVGDVDACRYISTGVVKVFSSTRVIAPANSAPTAVAIEPANVS